MHGTAVTVVSPALAGSFAVALVGKGGSSQTRPSGWLDDFEESA